ncbi:MAG: glycosyltransferase [Rhodocyclaceae bacterium]|nr:glycosyltransferase [Rhodocyclaceae bacterium]
MSRSDTRTHIVHVVNRLGVGGMENVVIQLVNELPPARFRHSIIAITDVMPDIAARIKHADVGLHALEKAPGQALWRYPHMHRLLRRLRPDVWHGCNLAALEFAPLAWMAGVKWRIHAEHGLEMDELRGRQPAYRWLRRLYRGCVHIYVAVSAPIAAYLQQTIGIPPAHLRLISNGVDLQRFRPWRAGDASPEGFSFDKAEHWVVGTVGRQEPIKNPLLLVDTFIDLVHAGQPESEPLRLAMIGEGSLHDEIDNRMRAAGLRERLWLPGNRNDVDVILRCLDCFVLPSLSEGTSCTLQEALACGLPVVATDVGGNRATLGDAGRLIPSQDRAALLAALQACRHHPAAAQAARAHAEQTHDLNTTLQAYAELFEGSDTALPMAKERS